MLQLPAPTPPNDPTPAPIAPPDRPELLTLILSGLKPRSAEGYLEDYESFRQFADAPSVERAIADVLALGQADANIVLATWQDAMKARGLSPATMCRRIAAVKRAFRRGRMFGLTSVIPETELPKAKAYRDTAGPGESGWAKMLAEATERAADGSPVAVRNRAILLLLFDRALRRGEVVGLDYPGDFNPTEGKVQVLGKGREQREWFTVSGRATAAVDAWLRVRGDWPGPLFTRLDPGAKGDLARQRMSGESVNRLVRECGVTAGLKRRVRAHGLRHAAITAALDVTSDYREVMAFSRHLDPSQIKTYDDNRKDLGGDLAKRIAGEKRARRKRG